MIRDVEDSSVEGLETNFLLIKYKLSQNNKSLAGKRWVHVKQICNRILLIFSEWARASMRKMPVCFCSFFSIFFLAISNKGFF